MNWKAAPTCRECNARIAFVELITWDQYTRGGRPVRFSNRMPIDIDPSPIGTVALFTWPKPLPGSGRPSQPTPARTVGRRLSAEEAAFYRADRGVLYRIHFDSCSARNRPAR